MFIRLCIYVAIKDINEFRDFTNELQKEFTGKIEEYNNVLVSEIIKLDYVAFKISC